MFGHHFQQFRIHIQPFTTFYREIALTRSVVLYDDMRCGNMSKDPQSWDLEKVFFFDFYEKTNKKFFTNLNFQKILGTFLAKKINNRTIYNCINLLIPN